MKLWSTSNPPSFDTDGVASTNPVRSPLRWDRALLVLVLIGQCVLAGMFVWGRRHPVAAPASATADAVTLAPQVAPPALPPPALPHAALVTHDEFAQLRDDMNRQMQRLMQLPDGFGPATPPTQLTAGPNPINRTMSQFMEQAMQDFRELEELIASDRGWGSLDRSPAMDMRDLGTNYLIACSLPGLEKTDVSVTLEGRLLTIAGQSSTQARPYFSSGSRFQRQVLLPGPVDSERAQASLSNGVLHVLVPKAPEMALNPTSERLL